MPSPTCMPPRHRPEPRPSSSLRPPHRPRPAGSPCRRPRRATPSPRSRGRSRRPRRGARSATASLPLHLLLLPDAGAEAASTRPILRRTVTEVTPTISGAGTSGEMGEVETGLGRGSGNTVRVQKITGRDFPMAAMISTQGTGAGVTETGGRTMVTGGPRLQTMLTRSLRGWTSS